MCGLSVKESMAQLYTEELCALAASIWLDHKSDHTQYGKEKWANWDKVKGQVVVISILCSCGSCQKERQVVTIGMSGPRHKHRRAHIKTQTADSTAHKHTQSQTQDNVLHMHTTEKRRKGDRINEFY